MKQNKLPSRKQRAKIKDEVLGELEDLIDENPNGPYTHNIIGLKLSGLASQTDVETANEVISELNLTELYGIYPVEA